MTEIKTERYHAFFSILLPDTLENIPFHNNVVNTDYDTVGNSFARHIASEIFKEFKKQWKKEDFAKLKPYLTFEKILSFLTFTIKDSKEGNVELQGGAESVAWATVNAFIELVLKEIQPA